MPDRKPSVIIKEILTCIDHIHTYTADITFETFTQNFMAVEACLYNIQIIGEAVSHLPDMIKDKETQIPWSLIKGMRNRLIHEYFGTDLSLVWDTIKHDLPSFQTALEKIEAELLKEGR
jgi:uncharacterized protein with HEPN domain